MGKDFEIVPVEDVEAVDAEPLQRILDRAHDAVIAVVEDLAARRRIEEFPDPRALFRLAEAEPAADLGREHVGIALLAAQEMVDARLGEAEAVKGRGVEIADASIPGGVQRRLRLVFRIGAVKIAGRGGAEAEFGEFYLVA